jgi:hypothetical protein
MRGSLPEAAACANLPHVSANRISLLIAALAAVAVAAVLVASGSGDEDPPAEPRTEEAPAEEAPAEEAPAEDEPTVAPNSDAHGEAHAREREREAPPEPAQPPELPEDPDAVRGSDPFALTRPANLRRALAVLEGRRKRVRGVLDGLRVAPGRIDTVIVRPDDRRTNIQVRADFEVAFESTHDFPTQAGFRRSGLTAADVDVRAPARLLRGIDRQRRGSAARDVDYVVLGKSVIDGSIGVTAYMRIRTPRPRYFRLEGGRVESFG